MKLRLSLLALGLSAITQVAGAQTPAPGADMILVRDSAKSPAEVVEAIKSYAEQKKWQYLGASKVKNGEVTLVKVCIPQVGQILWPVGPQISAMLPCGNIGVYQKQGKTEVSMLHPAYMQVLYPRPEVEKAVQVATPLLSDLLDTAAR
jgi:hypothetical protein